LVLLLLLSFRLLSFFFFLSRSITLLRSGLAGLIMKAAVKKGDVKEVG